MTNSTQAAVKKFQVGTTYSTRSICDYDCIYRFTVVSRTEKFVRISSASRGEVSRKVRVANGVEHIDPHGRYSMSPVLSADKTNDLN